MRDEYGHHFIQPFSILIIKALQSWTINVEHTQYSLAVKQWNDDLRIRRSITGDVSRKLMHIRHDNGFTLLRREPAYSFSKRYTHTSGLTLKWTKDEFSLAKKIKACPVNVGQRVVNQG